MARPRLNITDEERKERKRISTKRSQEKRKKEGADRTWDRKKWLEFHPEDQWIDDENQIARKRGYEDDDVRQLFAAMCLKACIDYKKASLGKKCDEHDHPAVTLEECRMFFGDDIFQFFVNRIPVHDIEMTILATPEDAIYSIWKRSENEQKPIKVV